MNAVASLNAHVNTGDSRSWTSLSIWIRMLTVISSSALEKDSVSKPDRNLVTTTGVKLTRSAGDDKLARRPALIGTMRTWQRRYSTTIGRVPQKRFGRPRMPNHQSSLIWWGKDELPPTLVSRFLSLFRSSDNSGAVMRLLFRF